MAEYIEREALIAEYDRVHKGSPGGARKLMVDAPAVDVVEVVRCKDCKWGEDLGMSGIYCNHPDNRNPCGCRPLDYCDEGFPIDTEEGLA